MLEILQGSSSSSTVRKYAFPPIDGEKVPLVLPPPPRNWHRVGFVFEFSG